MKVCSKCGLKKQFTEFYPSTSNRCGYTGKCKECTMLYYHKRKEGLANGTFKLKKEITSKTCKECSLELPVEKFYTTTTGLFSTRCISCTSLKNSASIKERGYSNERWKLLDEKRKSREENEIRQLVSDIVSGKIKHDPVAHENFCIKHKVLHHREWTFDLQRLREINDNVEDEHEKLIVKAHRTRLKNIGVDVDELDDDELYNDNFLL